MERHAPFFALTRGKGKACESVVVTNLCLKLCSALIESATKVGEATNDKNTVLSNKQMIKVSTGTIPDIPELRDAINKKWNIDSAPDDSVPRMYVQDVKNYVPESTIPQSNGGVNGRSGMPATLRAEMLTRSGEKITLEDAKVASGYGDYGAEVLAGAVNNAEGQTFIQMRSMVLIILM